MNIIAMLEEQRDRLRKELRAVENVLNQLKSEMRESRQPSVEVTAPSVTGGAHTPSGRVSSAAHRGDGARFLRALYTGPATQDELRHTLGLEQRHITRITSAEIGASRVVIKNGKLTLTELGKERAKWFVDNPHAKCFGKRT